MLISFMFSSKYLCWEGEGGKLASTNATLSQDKSRANAMWMPYTHQVVQSTTCTTWHVRLRAVGRESNTMVLEWRKCSVRKTAHIALPEGLYFLNNFFLKLCIINLYMSNYIAIFASKSKRNHDVHWPGGLITTCSIFYFPDSQIPFQMTQIQLIFIKTYAQSIPRGY